MRTRGFTFIEVLIVMVLIGIIAALGIPRIRDAIQKNNVRGARAALGTLVAKARGAAVQRGCRSAIHFTSGTAGTVWITACKVSNSALTDTLGGVEQLAVRYNLTLTAGAESMRPAACIPAQRVDGNDTLYTGSNWVATNSWSFINEGNLYFRIRVDTLYKTIKNQLRVDTLEMGVTCLT